MAFKTENDGINLSKEGIIDFTVCNSIAAENDLQLIHTEGSQNIKTDGECDYNVFKFECEFDRKIVESGVVKITNSCDTEVKITGLENTDPERFSLFSYPDYSTNVRYYTKDNTNIFPLSLQPTESISIPTFFHPLIEELEYGKSINRSDQIFSQSDDYDKFGAHIKIYPGIPISNCEDSQNSCNSFFTLSGSFICEEGFRSIDWMENQINFQQTSEIFTDQEDRISAIINSAEQYFCFSSTPIQAREFSLFENDQEEVDKLKESIDSYWDNIKQNVLNKVYPDSAERGLAGIKKISEDSDSISSLITKELDRYFHKKDEVIDTAVENYYFINHKPEDIITLNIDGSNFTGLGFESRPARNESRESTIFTEGQAVFFNITNTSSKSIIKIFTASFFGNMNEYNQYDICGIND